MALLMSPMSAAHAEVVVEQPVTPLTMMFGSVVEGGQVFTLPPEQNVLSEVTVSAGAPDGTEMTLEVYEWDSSAHDVVDGALFTSAPVNSASAGPESYTFDLGQLVLDPNLEYLVSFNAERFSYVLPGEGGSGFVWRSAAGQSWAAPGVGLAMRMVFLQAPAVTGLSPAEGEAGAEVTITGTGFDDTTEVSFGSVPASFEVVSDTQIVTVAPEAAPGTVVHVRVTSDGLLSTESSASEFTYAAPVQPVTPDTGVVDEDTPVLPTVGTSTPWLAIPGLLLLITIGVTLLARATRTRDAASHA